MRNFASCPDLFLLSDFLVVVEQFTKLSFLSLCWSVSLSVLIINVLLLQGTGPEVPKFLRYDGQVRNRRLGKRDTSLLIKDIWQEKAAHDAEVR